MVEITINDNHSATASRMCTITAALVQQAAYSDLLYYIFHMPFEKCLA